MNEAELDPDVVALMSELAALAPSEPMPAADQTAEQLRTTMREAIALFTRGVDPIPVHEVTDEVAPGRHGSIPVRVYRPETPTAVLVYLHGGGWVVGDIDTHDLVTRRLCRDTGALVVSVDYRMLPEHPFPAPMDDSYDATVWARALEPDLPLVVAGDSAGGTLAACVAIRARDEGDPNLDGQVLVYPAIDDDLDAPSMLAFRDGPGNSREDVAYYLHAYAATGSAAGSPYALPGRAESLAGLAPVVMVVPGHDLLRSAEEDYVTRLRAAGVDVTVQLDHELMHSWIDFAPRVASADRALTRLTDHVNELLRRTR